MQLKCRNLKRVSPKLPFAIILLVSSVVMGFDNYITSKDGKLFDGGKEFRFVSFNAPSLHYVEDYHFTDLKYQWTLPTDFEIEDVLATLEQLGGQAVRIMVLPVRKQGEDVSIPRYISGPGCFDEIAFRRLDKVIELANKHSVRLIIPFVDNYEYMGGFKQYAEFRGKEHGAFWKDEQIKNDFKRMILYVLNRKNYYTGVKYKEEKAVLAWELGNELAMEGKYPAEWVSEMAAFVKKNDGNHLLVDPWAWGVNESQLENPNIDIISSHFYPNVSDSVEEWIRRIKGEKKLTGNKKAYIVGEFGFISVAQMREVVDTVISEGVSGSLLWSLRGHTRNGGFYWHSECFKPYQTYHWPGFDSGEEREERSVLRMMRKKAYEIQGKSVPKLAVPEPPVLLRSDYSEAINWLGSVGAAVYDVERSVSPYGKWEVVGCDISDAAIPYASLFSDKTVSSVDYYYRVRSKNESGKSEPSNVIFIKNNKH